MRLSELEHRPDRPYDEADPSTLVLPNDTLARASDRELLAALCRAVIEEWEAAWTRS